MPFIVLADPRYPAVASFNDNLLCPIPAVGLILELVINPLTQLLPEPEYDTI